MQLQTWTWPTMGLVTVAYWVMLFAIWWLYTTRPSTQARARRRAFNHAVTDPETGETSVVFENAINVSRLVMIVIAPPAALALGWLLARAV